MVLRHASEKFRLAYELPLETYELFNSFHQFGNVSVDNLDEDSYRSDQLAIYDLWRKKGRNGQRDGLYDYQMLNDAFYENEPEDIDTPDYGEDEHDALASSSSIYQWHRDRHYDIHNSIIKYIDDKMFVTDSEFDRWHDSF
jgi:hypothetical protein